MLTDEEIQLIEMFSDRWLLLSVQGKDLRHVSTGETVEEDVSHRTMGELVTTSGLTWKTKGPMPEATARRLIKVMQHEFPQRYYRIGDERTITNLMADWTRQHNFEQFNESIPPEVGLEAKREKLTAYQGALVNLQRVVENESMLLSDEIR